MRTKPPMTRTGKTHKIKIGSVSLYVTINDLEIFVKCNAGWQGWCDVLAVTASLARQHGCPWSTIKKHWCNQAFVPDGIVGQGRSIPDAISRILPEDK